MRLRWRVFAVALLALLAGCGASGLFGGELTPTATVTPAPVPTVESRETPQLSLPPGVERSGLSNPVVLATAHGEHIVEQSYTWHERYREVVETPNGTRIVRRNETMWVAGATEYRHDFRRVRRLLDNTTQVYRQSTFSTGRRWYERRTTEAGEWTYANGSVGTSQDAFAGTAEFMLSRFLRARNVTTALVTHEGEKRFRLVGTGSYLSTLPDNGSYRVVAIVDAQGVVHRLDVRYTKRYGQVTERVHYTFWYGDIGETTVPRPDWIDRRPTGTGGQTATPLGPTTTRAAPPTTAANATDAD